MTSPVSGSIVPLPSSAGLAVFATVTVAPATRSLMLAVVAINWLSMAVRPSKLKRALVIVCASLAMVVLTFDSPGSTVLVIRL